MTQSFSISQKMLNFMERSSWIRKMFEEGIRLKNIHGKDRVFDFSLGNPDLPPPKAFEQTLARIAANPQPGVHAYMPNAGLDRVRERIAGRVAADHQTPITKDEIIMTCGAAGGLNIIFKAILNEGEEVITPAPYFVEYGFYVDNHGGKLLPVPANPDFSLNISAIESAINLKTKAVLINSPNNPTGAVYSRNEIKKLIEILTNVSQSTGQTIFLISDEPYRRLAFDGMQIPAILDLYENAIVTTSFSKDLSIPGERIGYVAINPGCPWKTQLLGAMTLANRILGFVNAPALMQRTVAEVINESVNVDIYQRRRDLFASILQEAGYEFTLPKGAFYFFPKTPIDDVKFVSLLQEELILAVPGTGFGCPNHIRLAFCVDEAVIEGARAGFKRAIERAKG